MPWDINFNGDKPANLQLEVQLCQAILDQRFSVSERVPSLLEIYKSLEDQGRLLSPQDLNILALAYRALEGMGVLETRQGQGIFVSPEAFEICQRYRDRGWKP